MIPAGRENKRQRRHIKRQLKGQLKEDSKIWWSKQTDEMEVAFASGNNPKLFKLIRDTGGHTNLVSETVTERTGAAIHNKARRLERWMEYFEEQFSWPSSQEELALDTLAPHTCEENKDQETTKLV